MPSLLDRGDSVSAAREALLPEAHPPRPQQRANRFSWLARNKTMHAHNLPPELQGTQPSAELDRLARRRRRELRRAEARRDGNDDILHSLAPSARELRELPVKCVLYVALLASLALMLSTLSCRGGGGGHGECVPWIHVLIPLVVAEGLWAVHALHSAIVALRLLEGYAWRRTAASMVADVGRHVAAGVTALLVGLALDGNPAPPASYFGPGPRQW